MLNEQLAAYDTRIQLQCVTLMYLYHIAMLLCKHSECLYSQRFGLSIRHASVQYECIRKFSDVTSF